MEKPGSRNHWSIGEDNKIMSMVKKGFSKSNIWAVIFSLIAGFCIAIFNPGQYSLVGFLSGFFFTLSSSTILIFVRRKVATSKQAGWATAASFFIRLLIGIILFITLPIFGYDEAPPNNGYLYLDAYERDTDAWHLAESGGSLMTAFQDEFYSDQYGGLLSLSAGIYRLFSPDGHRPLLILVLTAFLYSLSLPFFWQSVKDHWGEKTADISVWILALYPESIILGASQMREPILIGLSAISFWAIGQLSTGKKKALLPIGFCAFSLIFISYKAAAAIMVSLALFYWIDTLLPKSGKKARLVSFFFAAALIMTGVYFSWNWLVDSSKWDLLLMESSSGRIQWELELIGQKFQTPFIISYGLLQPVFPAAIVYPGIAITKAIAIFRSAGWYALLPFLLAAGIMVWKTQPLKERRRTFIMLALVFVWTLISSARAGGDQWDNPRYRSIFLIWYAVLAAMAYIETKSRDSRWLRRIISLEIIYSGFFIHWYLSRYFGIFRRMDFWPMIQALAAIGIVIILGGIVFDLFRKKKAIQNP